MAGSAVVGILRVLLSANTAEFDAAMAAAATSAKGLTKSFGDAGRQLQNVGMTLTKALTVPLVGLGVASAKAAIEFESSFAGIRKTVDGVVDSSGELTEAGKEIQQAMRDLAKEIPVSVNELNKLGETAGELGIPKEKVVEFTKVMAQLGVTTNLTAQDAATAIAGIQNIFGAAGVDTQKFASTLVALGNAGASTEKEIVEMSARISGAGHAIGLSQAQVLAYASTLSSLKINAEAGGSAISRVFLKINDAVASGGAKLDEFARVAGMGAAEFKKAFETDAAGATNVFISGLSRLKAGGENINATIEGLIGKNIILKDTLLRVSGAGELLSKNLALSNKAWQDNTALTKEAEQRFKTTEAQLTILWNRIKDVGITIGNALKPGIDSAIRGFELLLPVIDTVAKAFAALPGGVQLTVLAIAGIAAAIGPAMILIGQMSQGVSTITALFTKKGLAAKALSGDLITLEGAATKTSGALGLLSKAAGVAAAAFIGWQIGRLIADLTGLDQKIADSITGIENLRRARQLTAEGKGSEAEAEVQRKVVDLERQRTQAIQERNLAGAALLAQQIEALKNDQTRLAIQDTINAAIKRGADSTINYADAIKYNEEWLKKQQAAQAGVTSGVNAHGAAAAGAAQPVSELAKLTQQYAADLKKIGAAGFKDIIAAHDQFGVSLKDLAKQYDVAESSIDKYKNSQKSAGQSAKESAKDLKEVNAVVGEIVKTSTDLEKAINKQDEAWDKWQKSTIEGANKDALKIVQGWEKIGEDAGKKLAEGLAKSNKKFSDQAAALQKQLIAGEKDSLEKRLALIQLEFDERRRALDKNSALYETQLAALNADEARALEEGTQKWEDEAEKRRDAMISAIQGLSQAFSQLAQVSGDSFGGVVKSIGQMIASLALAMTSARALTASIVALGKEGGNTAGNWTQLAGASVALGGSLWQSSNPEGKSTGANIAQNALSWGAAGAQIGSIVPGVGNVAGFVVGAATGALVAWWRSSHQQWRQIGEDVGEWLGAPISEKLAKKIDEVRKTLEGGTKAQRQEWAALISLPDIIAEQGGLNSGNIAKFEQQTAGLFEIIQRGGANAKQAYDTLNTAIGQFAAYAESAGGMWDGTFKQLIAQSKALGINLESVNAAIDAQINKLSKGLGAAVAGAFAGSDKQFADLVKGLTPEQVSALSKGTGAEAGIDPAIIEQFQQIQAGTQEGFDRLSRTALAAFNTIVANGHSAFEAIAAIGPAIDQLIAEHDKLGLAGGAAYDQLARFRTLTKDNEALVASVGGLNDTMVALANLGGLNADVLADLEAQGLDTYGKLQAAGFTQTEALQQMAPFLQNLIDAHERMGIPIDENTQKLIDQAREQGILKDKGMSTNDILMAGFAALIKAVGGDMPEAFKKMSKSAADEAGKVTKAIDGIPSKKTVTIQYNEEGYPTTDTTGTGDTSQGPPPEWKHKEYPDDPDRRYATGGIVGPYESRGLAIGASMGRLLQFPAPSGEDKVPILAQEGEGMLNRLAMSRMSAADLTRLNVGMEPTQVFRGDVGNKSVSQTFITEVHHHHEWHAIDENSVRQFVRRSDFADEIAERIRTDGKIRSSVKRVVA